MAIGGIKIVCIDSFCEATNIKKDAQNDSSKFDELPHKRLLQEPFNNQEIIFFNKKG